jgi:tetratricopeptide (TPR) repeat protein
MLNSLEMRKWLALLVPLVLLVTGGTRLVTIEEQTQELRQTVVASVQRDDVQEAWERVCGEGLTSQSEVSCFALFLRTQGQKGRVPQSELGPTLLAAYAYDSGRWAEKSQSIDRAVFAYQLSLQLEPNGYTVDRLTHVLLGRAQYEVETIAVWGEVASALPLREPGYWWALGKIAELSEDWTEAAQAYGQGAALADDPYEFWMRQGVALRHLEGWEDESWAYRRAAFVRPESAWPLLNLGHNHYYRGDYEGARRLYSTAHWLAPDNVHPLHRLGIVYFSEERYSQARDLLDRALAVEADHRGSIYYSAQAAYALGDTEVAVDCLSRAVLLHPDRPWQWAVQLGDWQLELGNREGALVAYEMAVEWAPQESLAQQRLQHLGLRDE